MGRCFFGIWLRAEKRASGDLCFNTANDRLLREIRTDPSYPASSSPHLPAYRQHGRQSLRMWKQRAVCAGAGMREKPTPPSNFRSTLDFEHVVESKRIPGIYGLDTRALTRQSARKVRIMVLYGAVRFGSWRVEETLCWSGFARAPSRRTRISAGASQRKPIVTGLTGLHPLATP